MNRELFNQVVQRLSPFMGDMTDRRAIVTQALFGSPVLQQVNFDGNAHAFTVALLTTIDRYGSSADVVQLLMTVREKVGESQQAAFDALIAELQAPDDGATSSVEVPSTRPSLPWRTIYTVLAAVGGVIVAFFGIVQGLPPSQQTRVWLALRLVTVTPTVTATSTPTASATPTLTLLPSSTETSSPTMTTAPTQTTVPTSTPAPPSATVAPTSIPTEVVAPSTGNAATGEVPVTEANLLELMNTVSGAGDEQQIVVSEALQLLAERQIGQIAGLRHSELVEDPTAAHVDRNGTDMKTLALRLYGYNGDVTPYFYVGQTPPTLDELIAGLEALYGAGVLRDVQELGISVSETNAGGGSIYFFLLLGTK